jgi:hypothetical protein
MFSLLPLTLVFVAYWYVTGGQVIWMDDAYVEADKVGISTDVPGTVDAPQRPFSDQRQLSQRRNWPRSMKVSRISCWTGSKGESVLGTSSTRPNGG